MNPTDLELLAQFVRTRSNDAFTELVSRNLNLVYSVALRMVRSPQLAEEVSQSVFLDLAKRAHQMKHDTVLSAWLHRVTRCAAANVVRSEVRRQQREQIALELKAIAASTAPEIEPLLDDAIDALPEADRKAIALRFFENLSLHEVGVALGVSEDAAQKRVSRAVDRLRTHFTKRGVAVGSAGVVAVLATSTAHAAPAGLAADVCAAVSTAVATSAAAGTATTILKGITMTLAQKLIVTTAVTAVAGLTIYEIHQRAQTHRQLTAVIDQQTVLAGQVATLQRERDTARSQLQQANNELAAARTVAHHTSATVAATVPAITPVPEKKAADAKPTPSAVLRAKAEQVWAKLNEHPEWMIPELDLLTEKNWRMAINAMEMKWDTEEDARTTFNALRMLAKTQFAEQVQSALKDYAGATNGATDTLFSRADGCRHSEPV